MGQYTMLENKDTIKKLTEGMLENRELQVQFGLSDELNIINAMHHKHIAKLTTYRINT